VRGREGSTGTGGENPRIRDAGEKKSLDERSPGNHGLDERNPRARVMSSERREGKVSEEEEM
jgi:hypothetical protein